MIHSSDEDPEKPWFGRLMLLARLCLATGCGPWHDFALVWYVDEFRPQREHVIGARHFVFYGTRPDVVRLDSILQPCHLLPSPLRRTFGGKHVFVALPYGITHESTRAGWTYDEEGGEEHEMAGEEGADGADGDF